MCLLLWILVGLFWVRIWFSCIIVMWFEMFIMIFMLCLISIIVQLWCRLWMSCFILVMLLMFMFEVGLFRKIILGCLVMVMFIFSLCCWLCESFVQVCFVIVCRDRWVISLLVSVYVVVNCLVCFQGLSVVSGEWFCVVSCRFLCMFRLGNRLVIWKECVNFFCIWWLFGRCVIFLFLIRMLFLVMGVVLVRVWNSVVLFVLLGLIIECMVLVLMFSVMLLMVVNLLQCLVMLIVCRMGWFMSVFFWLCWWFVVCYFCGCVWY